MLSLITAVIINYQTIELTTKAYNTLRGNYPDIKILLVDNGSKDESQNEIRKLIEFDNNATLHINESNIYHGPAMHQSASLIQTDYILYIDSDCEIKRSGFIEIMLSYLQKNENNYAIGKLIKINRLGFEDDNGRIEYILPICSLIDRRKYFNLEPFIHHGAPCIKNMISAKKKGYNLLDFPVDEYVLHIGRGTSSRYGYGLGLSGIFDFILDRASRKFKILKQIIN